MKNKVIILGSLIGLAALIIGLGVGRYLVPSRAGLPHDSALGNASPDGGDSAEPTTWTCSMHPQIQQPDEGDCPICGMDLIPLESDSGADEGPRVMSMSESSRALADIQTTEAFRDFPEAEVRLVGKLDYDETREKSLSARFPARIDKLYVNFTGVKVQTGEHLAEVYSPDLLTAQRELLTAYRSDPDSSITLAAREKLRLWDLLPGQIDEIIERGEARDHFELKAPIGGVVVSKHVKEGDYVKTGQSLFRIIDLGELWLNLDAYESDLAWLRFGQTVSFSVEAFPGEVFEGKITFINPELDRKTRTVSIRVNVPNEDGRLKPGMFAKGVVSARMAEGGRIYAPELAGKWISPMHPEIVKDGPGQCDVCGMDLVPAEDLGYVQNTEEIAPVVVPASSVLRTGKRAVVYVEKPDKERPTYEGREIVLGPRAGDSFIVLEGLDEGERVVSNGAFKIDSALQIQAKPSMMNPQGGGSVAGHDHGGSTVGTTTHGGSPSQIIEISSDKVGDLVSPYLKLQAALAADNFNGALEGAKDLMSITGHAGPLPDLIHEMLASSDLQGIRDPHFETLSNSMIKAIKGNPASIQSPLLVMHCPMALGGAGADWLQDAEPLQNPYYGAMMLKCGEIKETVSPTQNGQNNHAH